MRRLLQEATPITQDTFVNELKSLPLLAMQAKLNAGQVGAMPLLYNG